MALWQNERGMVRGVTPKGTAYELATYWAGGDILPEKLEW